MICDDAYGIDGGKPGTWLLWRGLLLSPVVAGVAQALVHDVVEAGAFLDEDFAEGAVLPQENGLEAH
jgi:hypothetical protein